MREWSLQLYLLDEDGNERPADVFTKVVYNLHPTFANPVQTFTKPPFLCSNEGWGEFEINIECYTTEKTKLPLITHDLNFQEEKYQTTHTVVFKNPSQALQERLRETGPLPNDEERQKKKGAAGKKGAQKYDYEKIAEALEKLDEEDLLRVIQLINENKGPDTYIRSDVEGGGRQRSQPAGSSSATTPAPAPAPSQQPQEHQPLSQQHALQHAQQHAQLGAQGPQHKRVYQACIPCRRRKVRCDLGSVDNPHDPPCVRCRRESKECFFSATRRKRKTDDDGEGSDVDDYVIRNGRKRAHPEGSPPPRLDRRFYSDVPLTPGGSHGRSQPLRRPDGGAPRQRRDSELDGDGDANLENLEAQTAMRRAVYNPHDALDLLYKAATDRCAVPEPSGTMMPGTGGHCRSHAIPEQLWTYLRGMIERCLWGQEAFGGGFCGSGGPGSSSLIVEESDTSSTAPWRGMRKGSLRTLGTIESLLILTEWHPRALHFPPQEATDELMLPDYGSGGPTIASDDSNRNLGAGFGGKRIESWLEPAWRSDRMCWMLLSTAMGLAYELGVFDNIDEMLRDDTITRPEFMDEPYRTRANRIKRLLLIYTSQLAGRLGWTSMTPEHLRKADPAVARRRTMSNEGNTPSTASMVNGFNYVPDLELDDQIIHCWAGISNAMHIGNEKLFRSRKYTTEIIQSGRYVELLRDFSPLLKDWYREFELFRLPPFIRHILTIEYEYVRIYVNSLSLQAVVERCTSNAGHTANGSNGNGNGNGAGGGGGGDRGQAAGGPAQLSPQTMINYGKLPLGQLGGFTIHDQEYVREVVDGCRNLLRTVVEGLLPGGYLKHAPVRTYFRIISGAMFLLKTFALGAPRSDVKMSIDLMDATTEALRNCVVDDVHLGIRFADLLETLTSRLRNRFIQAPSLQQQQQQQQQQPGAGSPPPEGVMTGGGGGGGGGDPTASWVGKHAQKLREGLNGQYRPASPGADGNISATPFDLSACSFPHGGASSVGPSTPAAHVDSSSNNINNNINNNSSSSNVNGGAAAAAAPGVDLHLFEDWNDPGNEMWYLPPGPAFFQNMGDSSVAMTAEGVNVGGLDLLEYMAMDPVQFPGIDGPTGAGSGGGNAGA
ncbi:hypothetical protein UVI_02003050 [Ustilaginoidea virens]|uniref:Uncharacterized protein n=1 Tax=Ustilaginoidea virens TaxID=1159556 RepID=A0A1B5L261_USTVR|nr:hypothetical protein UVI_02003050 [Ustilaginoidea virens]